MKRISVIMGLCLMAIVAFSAVAAATASATPPTLLLKLTSGTYPATFTSKGETASTLETANKNTITCGKIDNEGTLENAHLGKVLILFLECSTTILDHTGPCGNNGSKTSIMLPEAVFHFGSILLTPTEASPGVLVLLPGKEFSFECTEVPIIGKVTIKVTGEGIAGLVGVPGGGAAVPKTKYSALTLVYQAGSTTGTQKYTEFLLPLEENKVMTGLQLKSENSFEKKSENSSQSSNDTLEKFKNSTGGSTEVEIEEG